MNQIINTQLTTETAVAAGGLVPVGNIVHRSGCNLNATGNTVKVEGAGYFKIIANITFAPTAESNVVVTLYDNGTQVAQAQATPSAAAGYVNLTLARVLYNRCGCMEDDITIGVNVAGTVAELDVVVERV